MILIISRDDIVNLTSGIIIEFAGGSQSEDEGQNKPEAETLFFSLFLYFLFPSLSLSSVWQ